MKRKPIRMTTVQDEGGDEKLIVICDDGSMWMYGWGDEDAPQGSWFQLAAIPPDTPPEQQQEPPRQPE